VEDQDDLGLIQPLQPQGKEQKLNRDRIEEQEVVTRQRPVSLPEQLGGDDAGQHEPAEQAGPGFLEAENEEFSQKGRQAVEAAMRPTPRRLQIDAVAISLAPVCSLRLAHREAIAMAAPAMTTLLVRLTILTAFELVIRRRARSATRT
jgi:hypothetical protein